MSESNLEQRVLELENSKTALNQNLYETTRLLIDVCGELSRVKKDQHQICENIYNYLENVVDWAEYPDPEKRKILKGALLRTAQSREQMATALADFESKIEKIQLPPEPT
jgi:predicted Fe-S protein YdhL (DUF1289 family)